LAKVQINLQGLFRVKILRHILVQVESTF